MPSDVKSSHGLWPGKLKSNSEGHNSTPNQIKTLFLLVLYNISKFQIIPLVLSKVIHWKLFQDIQMEVIPNAFDAKH